MLETEHRHDPSDLEAEPCCPDCCECAACCSGVCDRHNCCCEHVVEELDAMPGDVAVLLDVARDRYARCPHNGPTMLDQYVDELREHVKLMEHA